MFICMHVCLSVRLSVATRKLQVAVLDRLGKYLKLFVSTSFLTLARSHLSSAYQFCIGEKTQKPSIPLIASGTLKRRQPERQQL